MLDKAMQVYAHSGKAGLRAWYLSLSEQQQDEFKHEINATMNVFVSCFEALRKSVVVSINAFGAWYNALPIETRVYIENHSTPNED